jgi:hypothetical protein
MEADENADSLAWQGKELRNQRYHRPSWSAVMVGRHGQKRI